MPEDTSPLPLVGSGTGSVPVGAARAHGGLYRDLPASFLEHADFFIWRSDFSGHEDFLIKTSATASIPTTQWGWVQSSIGSPTNPNAVVANNAPSYLSMNAGGVSGAGIQVQHVGTGGSFSDLDGTSFATSPTLMLAQGKLSAFAFRATPNSAFVTSGFLAVGLCSSGQSVTAATDPQPNFTDGVLVAWRPNNTIAYCVRRNGVGSWATMASTSLKIHPLSGYTLLREVGVRILPDPRNAPTGDPNTQWTGTTEIYLDRVLVARVATIPTGTTYLFPTLATVNAGSGSSNYIDYIQTAQQR